MWEKEEGVHPYGRRGFIFIGGIFAGERENHPIGAGKEEAFLWTKRFGGRNEESLLFLQENRIELHFLQKYTVGEEEPDNCTF